MMTVIRRVTCRRAFSFREWLACDDEFKVNDNSPPGCAKCLIFLTHVGKIRLTVIIVGKIRVTNESRKVKVSMTAWNWG